MTRQCRDCHRTGARAFLETGDGSWICSNAAACRDRQQAQLADQPAERLESPTLQGETGHLLGWCNDGFHAGRRYRYGTPCPGVATPIRRTGLDQQRSCECPCHHTHKPAGQDTEAGNEEPAA